MEMSISVPRYTIEDLDRFPDDGNRYELMDGMLLVTPAPNTRHQLLAAELAALLRETVGDAAWISGPGAIQRKTNTQLQPDVLVFPKRFSPDTKWIDINGHWLAVEILSRSSRIYDREFKRDAYLKLGVREVWIVDPIAETIELSKEPGRSEIAGTVIRWRLPDSNAIVPIDVMRLFAALRQ